MAGACRYSENLHIRNYSLEVSLFMFLCDDVIPVIGMLVLSTGSKMPGKMIGDNSAFKDGLCS